jgi:co-chaperonin GroES (HSP10)
MPSFRKKLIVVGDRILVKAQEGEERTNAGLYLPATAVNEQQVRAGRVVKVGPGTPIPEPLEDEPWKKKKNEPRYIPLQAREGDYVIFLKTAAVEITFEGQRYQIVPNSAVLVLARDEFDIEDELSMDTLTVEPRRDDPDDDH